MRSGKARGRGRLGQREMAVTMPKLTYEFVQSAFRESSVWDLGNRFLYVLCTKNFDHKSDDVIIAKFWLIGRSYSAAVERRRNKDDSAGEEFYEKCLAPKVRHSDIDLWFRKLGEDSENSQAIT